METKNTLALSSRDEVMNAVFRFGAGVGIALALLLAAGIPLSFFAIAEVAGEK